MTLKNPKLFGLNVLSLLADVQSKNTAIRNLGLNPLDLEVIRGSKNAGMDRDDWISFSRLRTPIYKTLDRFSNESTMFQEILLERAGTDQTLFGNLDLNGSFAGNAIRYRYRDFTSNTFKIADISTSRVSAWSSSDSRANDPNINIQKLAKISYGARVSIHSGGKLIFENKSTDDAIKNQQRLQTRIVPEAREFDSEVPTSKIKCKIGNEILFLYAMKGIPLVFKGFFRNLDASIQLNYVAPPKASWKIVETGNQNLFTNFENQTEGITSAINYRSPISRERFIKFYYNPDKILKIQIRSANIKELPATALPFCDELDFAYNQLKLFPNFKFIAPTLTTLKTMRNPFYLSDIESQRKFNTEILNKIPDTLTHIEFEGSFSGSIERNIISQYLPNLTIFNCQRGGGKNFNQDNRPSGSTQVKLNGTLTTGNNAGNSAFCPDVSRSCRTYLIGTNDFRSVDLNDIEEGGKAFDSNGVEQTYEKGSCSFKKLPQLNTLSVGGNYHLSDGAGDSTALTSADNNTIVTINYGSTNLKIPSNLAGCSSLKEYSASYNRNHVNSLMNGSSYAFSACGALEKITLNNTNLGQVRFPIFNNPNLKEINLNDTEIKGGNPLIANDADQTEVITIDTFKECPNLTKFTVRSGRLLKLPINKDAFQQNAKLTELTYISEKRSNGNIVNLFNYTPLLNYLNMSNNAFTGTVPSFQIASSISHVDLSTNQLSGNIPGFALNRLKNLYLQSNQLEKINQPGLNPSLQKYQAHNNLIKGDIPNFELCTVLRTLTLNNNKLTGYVLGAFEKLYRIKFIDVSNNHLSTTSLNNLLIDLEKNYDTTPRGGVTINLKNQTSESNQNIQLLPSEDGGGYAAARKLISKGWTIGITGGIPPEPEEDTFGLGG